jgi:hypothetical protein
LRAVGTCRGRGRLAVTLNMEATTCLCGRRFALKILMNSSSSTWREADVGVARWVNVNAYTQRNCGCAESVRQKRRDTKRGNNTTMESTVLSQIIPASILHRRQTRGQRSFDTRGFLVASLESAAGDDMRAPFHCIAIVSVKPRVCACKYPILEA